MKDPEIIHCINNMIQDTSIILQRRSIPQIKLLREIWVETGILLDEWNKETEEILRAY